LLVNTILRTHNHFQFVWGPSNLIPVNIRLLERVNVSFPRDTSPYGIRQLGARTFDSIAKIHSIFWIEAVLVLSSSVPRAHIPLSPNINRPANFIASK
jgi:hypothetical protein